MSDEQFNLGQVFETVAATVPEREAIVWGDRRLSYAELRDRSRRLAMFLHERGLGAHGAAGSLWPGTNRARTTSGSISTTATSTSRG